MKKSPIPLLAAAAAIFGAPVASAATISYSGQIELGQSGFDDVGTVDYIWFRVTSDKPISGTLCVSGMDTALGSLHNANLATHLVGLQVNSAPPFAFGSANTCWNGVTDLAAGEYVFVVTGDNSDWSPMDGVVPFKDDNTDTSPSYTISWQGDGLVLDSIWAGNLNGTFSVTVPEPSTALALGLGCALVLGRGRGHRQKRAASWSASAMAIIALVFGGESVRAERITSNEMQVRQGVLRWTTVNGMGYRLERTSDAPLPAPPLTPELGLPIDSLVARQSDIRAQLLAPPSNTPVLPWSTRSGAGCRLAR